MKGVGFKDVVIRGKELSGALITALINVYIKDNASVDAISNHLRDICPLLYSSDDSICSKVHANICLILAVLKCVDLFDRSESEEHFCNWFDFFSRKFMDSSRLSNRRDTRALNMS